MSPRGRSARIGIGLAGAMLVAGCAGTAAATPAARRAVPPAAALDASLATATGAWAVVVMGGSAAQHNNFWQLFTRPAGSSSWRLVTPPGTADNGGLVLAGDSGQALITAFRPSQGLTYTPLIRTGDSGQAWSSLNPLDAALISSPDALALQPRSDSLLALTTRGTAELAAPGYTSWKVLTTTSALAATQAGRRCRLQSLTAATFTSAGTPLLAGTCSRPGTAGIFAYRNGAWQAAGPPLPAALDRRAVTVLRLTRTPSGISALLAAGTSMLAAWSDGNGSGWKLSPPLRLRGRTAYPTSFGPDGSAGIILPGGRGEVVTPGGQWVPLPALPTGTAALALGAGGQADALAVAHATLTVWQLPRGGTAWAKAQVIHVPIQYGSSS
jgi:hypothetical protein